MGLAVDVKDSNPFSDETISTWASPNCMIADALKNLPLDERDRLAGIKELNDFDLYKMTIAARNEEGQHIGFYVGDTATYEHFAPAVNQVIQKYHKIDDVYENKQIRFEE